MDIGHWEQHQKDANHVTVILEVPKTPRVMMYLECANVNNISPDESVTLSDLATSQPILII